MNKTATLFALTASALLAACDDVGGWGDLFDSGYDTWDTGEFYEGDVLIAELAYGCDPGNPDTWWFEATNQGWAGDMVLDIYETGDGNWPSNPGAVWDETHNLTNTQWAEDGTWDFWELSLRDVESAGSQTASQSTLFSCGWNDGNSLAFMITLYDEDMRERDCAIWGQESDDYFNDYRNNNCVCFEADGNCNN